MIDLFFQILICGLATWQIVEILHHGHLFARLRASWEVERSFRAALLCCPFCLSPWIAWLLMLLTDLWPSGGYVIAGGFAASRLANVFNDLTYYANRTPRQQHYAEYVSDEEDQKDAKPGRDTATEG